MLSLKAINLKVGCAKEECLSVQGCQIFIDTKYQNEAKYIKLPQHYLMAIKYAK
jgi:hypothetical protein